MMDWFFAFALALAAPTPATAAPAPVTPESIMALPPELKARLHAEVIEGNNSRNQRFDRLVEFMFESDGLGMSYQAEPTPTVSEAYASRKANCLGFTLMFLALAQEAGLEAWPQEIRETLSWRQQDGTIYRASHVNASVRVGARSFTVDVARDAIIARFDPERIEIHELLAHYHNNLAIELLGKGEITRALLHIQEGLALDPDNPSHWTNAGVLHLRNGDRGAAQAAYERALQINPREAGALFNMVSLAQRNGDHAQERSFRRQLEKVQKTDPFYHFLLAVDYERSGNYKEAIGHYQRAILWHRDEHRFFAALARAYLLAGDSERAGKALSRAHDLTEGGTRAAYGAKLDRLR